MKRISLLLLVVIGCQAADVVADTLTVNTQAIINGTAPTTVTAGQVKIGGGIVYGKSNVANVTNAYFENNNANGYGFASQGGAGNKYVAYFADYLGNPILTLHADSNASVFKGMSPASVAIGEVRIGGGQLFASSLVGVTDLNGGGFRGGRYSAADPNLYVIGGWLPGGAGVRAGIKFNTSPASASAPFANALTRMEITPDGSVIIGDFGATVPTSKLAVNGTISAKEIKVTTTGADYVFDDTYRLRPLMEVEQFIKDNRHLPEIPSAKVMQQDGMGVSEIVTKQLAKIEELTLYAIQAERERAAQAAQAEKQADRLATLEQQVATMATANAQLMEQMQFLLKQTAIKNP